MLYSEDVTHRIIETVRQRSTKPTDVIVTGDHGELLLNEDELMSGDTQLEDPANKTIYVHGSDIHGLAGS